MFLWSFYVLLLPLEVTVGWLLRYESGGALERVVVTVTRYYYLHSASLQPFVGVQIMHRVFFFLGVAHWRCLIVHDWHSSRHGLLSHEVLLSCQSQQRIHNIVYVALHYYLYCICMFPIRRISDWRNLASHTWCVSFHTMGTSTDSAPTLTVIICFKY